jgi:hypothetical protein
MLPETKILAGDLLNAIDNASAQLVNPDDVGYALGVAIAERHSDDRLVVASYLSLLASILHEATKAVEMDAIACDGLIKDGLVKGDAQALARYKANAKATRSLHRLSKATLKTARIADDATHDASHA